MRFKNVIQALRNTSLDLGPNLKKLPTYSALLLTEPHKEVGGENSFAINNRFSKLHTILPANPFRFFGVDIHFYTWNNL